MSEIMNGFHGGNGLGLGHLKSAGAISAAQISSPSVSEDAEDEAVTGSAAGSGEAVVDEVEVSEEGESFLGALTRPGKSHQSTAHRALAALEENPSLAGLPFGKIVSTLAKTGSLESLLPPPVENDEIGQTSQSSEVEATGEVPAGGASPTPALTDPLLVEDPVEGSVAVSLLEAIADQHAESDVDVV